MSLARRLSFRRSATSRSKASPASWPRLSLMILKRSRSMNSTANLRWLRRDSAGTWFSSSAEHHAVGQPGQAVVRGQILNALFGLLARRDVARHAAVAREAAVVVGQRLTADADERRRRPLLVL